MDNVVKVLYYATISLILANRPVAGVGEGGGGYCHIWVIEVCATVKCMVFKQFTLG